MAKVVNKYLEVKLMKAVGKTQLTHSSSSTTMMSLTSMAVVVEDYHTLKRRTLIDTNIN